MGTKLNTSLSKATYTLAENEMYVHIVSKKQSKSNMYRYVLINIGLYNCLFCVHRSTFTNKLEQNAS